MRDATETRKGDARVVGEKRIAVTVKLDEELYGKLVSYSSQFVPRKTHQAIVVEALERFLENEV